MTTVAAAVPPVVAAGPGPRARAARLAPSAVAALAMLIVGVVGLDNPALGWDENATWMVARRSVAQIVALAGNIDGVVAPYYLFMHYWTAIAGTSEVAMRLPSLIGVAAGVGAAAELGRRLFGPATGLAGGLFLVAVPQLSRYAQDARAYGFLFLFATLATLLLHSALHRPSKRRWIRYGLCVTLLGWAHMMGLLVLAGHAVAALSRPRPHRDPVARAWAVTVAAAVLPVLPLVALGLRQRDKQLGWIGELGVTEVLEAPGAIFRSPAAGLLLIGLALSVRWPYRPVVRDLAALAVLPPLLLLGASASGSSMWVPRYVIVVLVPVCLLAAAALHDRPARTILALLVTGAVALPAHHDVRGPAAHVGLNFRTAAALVTAGQRPGDGILYGRVGTWSLRAGFDYQTRGRPAPADVLLTRSAADAGSLTADECAVPESCLGAVDRVWYLGQRRSTNLLQDLGARHRNALDDAFRLVQLWPLDGGTVALYERR